MRLLATTSATLLSVLAAMPLQAGETSAEPVIVRPLVLDGKPIAPGGAVSQIMGLKKGGDGFVSVRAAPSTKAEEIGRLTEGTFVIAAFEPKRGTGVKFIGVIYDLDDTSEKPMMERCGLPEGPPYFDGTYKGPCKSGWVAERFVKVLAD